MRIAGVKIKLPKSEKALNNFFKNCKARHKFVDDVPEHHKKRLKKAKHDLNRAIAEFEEECWDWTIIKSYYAIFHAGNALLSMKKGIFSKDHSCLIVALTVWNLVDKKLFLKISSIYERFSDILSIDLSFQLRKISQYDVDLWEDLTRDDALILDLAREFVSYVEGEIYA